MVVFRKNMLHKNDQTTLISFKNEFLLDHVEKIYELLKKREETDLFILKTIETQKLYGSSKWTEIFTKDKEYNFIKSPNLAIYKNNPSKLEIKSGYHGTYSNYLMLPNKEWNIEELNQTTFKLIHITIAEEDEQSECQIPSSYLIPAIRKSSDANSLVNSPNCFVLNLPYNLPRELDNFRRKYIHWAENELEARWEQDKKKGHKRIPIIKRPTYKKNRQGLTVIDEVPWYSHAFKNKCHATKSNLFVLKKYQVSARKTVAPYSNVISSVNHGSLRWLKTPNDKFYASWMNSSLFLLSLFNNQRIIHKDYWMMMVGDFNTVVFPIYESFDEKTIQKVIKQWQNMVLISNDELPFLPQQLGADLVKKSKKKKNPPPDQVIHYERLSERVELDIAWLHALGVSDDQINETIDEIYDWLIEYMETR